MTLTGACLALVVYGGMFVSRHGISCAPFTFALYPQQPFYFESKSDRKWSLGALVCWHYGWYGWFD